MHPPPDTVTERPVRILLECILVIFDFMVDLVSRLNDNDIRFNCFFSVGNIITSTFV